MVKFLLIGFIGVSQSTAIPESYNVAKSTVQVRPPIFSIFRLDPVTRQWHYAIDSELKDR